jgi:DNA-binding GntR family transcriptional regulator
MTGEFRPGASITLREAARLVGTSVMPVREAVRRLMAQHALILQRNKAIQIPVLSDTDFDQLWHLRALLEGEACAQATPLIDTSEFELLSTLLTEALSAAKAHDMRPIIINAHEFLFRIYRASQNSMLVSMIEMLWLRTGPLYFDALASVSHLAFIRKGLKNDARLLDAIRARDAAVARETREMDLRELASWLREHRERRLSRAEPVPGVPAAGETARPKHRT